MCSMKIRVQTRKEVDMRHRKLGTKGIPRRTVNRDTRKMVNIPCIVGLEQIRKLQNTLLQENEIYRVSHVLNVLRIDLGNCPR